MARHIERTMIWIASLGLAALLIASLAQAGSWLGWLRDYQTLVAGAAAFFGAYLAYISLERQIEQGTARDRDQLRRESYAARAVLPMSLTAITKYAKQCAAELLASLHGDELVERDYQFPDPPTDAIAAIRDCVRLAEEGKARELADLVAELQVQSSRVGAMSGEEIITVEMAAEHCLDAAELYARASALVDYGRRKPDKEPIETLTGAGLLCGIIPSEHPLVDARLAAHEEAFHTQMLAYRSTAQA